MITSCVHLTRPFNSTPDSRHMEIAVWKPERRIGFDRLKTEHSGNNKTPAHFLIASPQTHGFQAMTRSKKQRHHPLLRADELKNIVAIWKSDWASCRSSNWRWRFIFCWITCSDKHKSVALIVCVLLFTWLLLWTKKSEDVTNHRSLVTKKWGEARSAATSIHVTLTELISVSM